METLMNVVVVVMLGMTMVFCWQLNKKIIELRQSKQYMLDLVKNFDSAVINTHKSIMTLKETSTNATIELRTNVVKAEELVKDLAFLNQTGTAIADNLENFVHNAKNFALTTKKLLAEMAKRQELAAKDVAASIEKGEEDEQAPESKSGGVAAKMSGDGAIQGGAQGRGEDFSEMRLDFAIDGDVLGEFLDHGLDIIPIGLATGNVANNLGKNLDSKTGEMPNKQATAGTKF